MGAVGEMPEFDIRTVFKGSSPDFSRGFLMVSFPQGDTSARTRGFEVWFFPTLW